MTLLETFPSPQNVEIQPMKSALTLALVCASLLFGGCAGDTSLLTDEEYRASKGPAPHAPDFSSVLPTTSSTYNPGY